MTVEGSRPNGPVPPPVAPTALPQPRSAPTYQPPSQVGPTYGPQTGTGATPPWQPGAGQGEPLYTPQRPRRRTGLIAGLVALGVVVLAALAVGAFLLVHAHVTAMLNTDKAAAEIGRITQQQFGVAPSDVRCPSDVPLKQGTSTTCTARLEGQQLAYTVTQSDDQGNVHISSDSTITAVTKLQDWLAGEVGKQAGVPTTASCDAGARTVLVGAATVRCTVLNSQDPTDTAAFTVHVDDAGTASYERAS